MYNRTKKLLVIVALCLQVVLLQAQATKSITVSQKESYTDHLTLQSDSKDMDLMVKFMFNEEKNTLTVSVISYRTLFVFWENTRYKGVVKNRRIRIDKLPYVAVSNSTDQFRLSKKFLKTLPNPHKKYIFRKWIEVDGLQPADHEIKMVNDYIEQTFNIQGKRNNVTVTLHDIMLMDLIKKKKLIHKYEISSGKDLNTVYQLTIQRDPCFGLDDEMAAAQKTLDALQKSFTSFQKKYGGGVVNDDASKQTFQELQKTLTDMFPKITDSSACPVIQQARNLYNQRVDSILQMKVAVVSNTSDILAAVGGDEGRAINAKLILSNARQLDNTVAIWLVSKDEREREDLLVQGRDIIKGTSAMIGNSHGKTPEEQNAISLFRKAEQYFNKVCK